MPDAEVEGIVARLQAQGLLTIPAGYYHSLALTRLARLRHGEGDRTSDVSLPCDGSVDFTSGTIGWDVETGVGTHILRATDGGRQWTTVHVPAP